MDLLQQAQKGLVTLTPACIASIRQTFSRGYCFGKEFQSPSYLFLPLADLTSWMEIFSFQFLFV
jgi:hypothetical protein